MKRRATILFLMALCGAAVHGQSTDYYNARLEGMDDKGANLTIRDCPAAKAPMSCPGAAISVRVTDAAMQTQVKAFAVGDHLRLTVAQGVMQDFRGASVRTASKGLRLFALAACALAIFLLAAGVTRWHPLKFVMGMDNRYSGSKVQVAFWFLVVISTYLAMMVLRVSLAGFDLLGGVNIPQNLLILSGLSAITFTGAKAITTAKQNSAVAANANAAAAGAAAAVAAGPGAAVMVAAVPMKTIKVAGGENFFADLVMNDVGGFDFGDFQMLVVTVLAAVTYLLLFLHFAGTVTLTRGVTLPDLDTTILSLVGLGQGAYLTKKAVGNLGTT